MILNIENLGVIKKAQIDLSKKFILFCGRNSTGKTYASYVLQAFLEQSGIYNLDCIETIVKQIISTKQFKIEKSFITEWLDKNCKNVTLQTGSIFGISDATSNKLFNKFNISVEYTDEDYKRSLNTEIKSSMKDGQLVLNITKQAGSDVVTIEDNMNYAASMSHLNIRTVSLICMVLRDIAFCNHSGVRMLTVERNSIYTFKTELSLSRNELIDRIQQQSDKAEIDIFGIINSSSRRYPQAVRSSLRIANDLENVQKYASPYADVADMMEKDLLKGEVSVTKNGDVEFHAQNMSKTKRLPFHLSSSIVKTMASLVIYLRHIARTGDTLIIDEPEMNFHPDVQVMLAKIFAILTAKGLRIVVSTHSDYIVRELNNLIMAAAIRNKGEQGIADKFGYTDDMLLAHRDVSVLFFEQTSKQFVTVSKLPVEEDGFSVASIDDTITKQNEMAERLYDTLIDIEQTKEAHTDE